MVLHGFYNGFEQNTHILMFVSIFATISGLCKCSAQLKVCVNVLHNLRFV